MLMYTAHKKSDFNTLLEESNIVAVELDSRDKTSDALFMYLTRLRTGRTFEEIASDLGVSECTVRRRCQVVRTALKNAIVPKYINYEMGREELQAHKSACSRILFDGENPNSVHLILDGTYIYVEKSKNHRFQKQSYNSHKKRNYVKIMMGVLTDGTILFTLGPFKATEDDAKITRAIFDSSSPSIKTLLPQDVLIVDRGFERCMATLMNLGFIVQMPSCSHTAQLSTKEANESRFVTKVRYDVERVNGLMKVVWKIFMKTANTHQIPKIMTDFEIGAALLNRREKSHVNEEKSIEFARGMIRKLNVVNNLSIAVKKNGSKT